MSSICLASGCKDLARIAYVGVVLHDGKACEENVRLCVDHARIYIQGGARAIGQGELVDQVFGVAHR